MRKAVSFLIVLLAFNLYFFEQQPPLFGTLSFLLLMVVIQFSLAIAFFNFSSKEHKINLALQGLAIFFSSVVLFRASLIDRMTLSFGSVLLTILASYNYLKKDGYIYSLVESILSPLILAKQWFIHSFVTVAYLPALLASFLSRIKRISDHKGISPTKYQSLVRGIVIAVPIVFVLLILLTSADPIFAQYLNDFFNFDFFKHITISARLVQNFVIGFILFSFLITQIKNDFISPFANKKQWRKFSTEASVVVSLVVFILLLFLLVQFKYLFTTIPETELHRFGINTYSEYVRKGFQELVLVSVLVYLTSGLSMVIERSKEKGNDFLKWLNVSLLAEALIFIFSIFRRVILYQSAHGLTRIRAYGSVFLIMLMTLTILLILRHLVKKKVDWYVFELSAVFFIVLTSTLLGVDQTIANNFPPTVNEEIDYNYLSRLSADAYQGWIKGTEFTKLTVEPILTKDPITLSDEEVRQIRYGYNFVSDSNYHYQYLIRHYGTEKEAEILGVELFKDDWRNFNIGEWFAYNQLTKHLDFVEFVDLKTRLSNYYFSLSQDQRIGSLDRSFDTPLLN